jgi:hypothetical protein
MSQNLLKIKFTQEEIFQKTFPTSPLTPTIMKAITKISSRETVLHSATNSWSIKNIKANFWISKIKIPEKIQIHFRAIDPILATRLNPITPFTLEKSSKY